MTNISINLSSIAHKIPARTKRVGEFHDYIFNKGKTCIDVKGLLTENINTCTAGELIGTNTKTGRGHNYMFHLAPEQQSLNSLEDNLSKQLETLRETCDDIQGFICGGRALDTNSNTSIKSFDLYNTLADLFDKYGVKFSMLCGKAKNAPMENIYGVNKSINIWSDAYKNLLQKGEKPSQKEIQNILENQYEIVERADNHIFNLMG